MIRKGEDYPFDISPMRAIVFDVDVLSGQMAMNELEHHIKSMSNENSETDNPISNSLTMRDLVKSGKTEQYTIAQIIQELRDIRTEFKSMQSLGLQYRPTTLTVDYPVPYSDIVQQAAQNAAKVGVWGYDINQSPIVGNVVNRDKQLNNELEVLKNQLNTSILSDTQKAVIRKRIKDIESALEWYN